MAVKGYSTKFQYGDGATPATSSTWTDFAGIIDIKPPKIEAQDIETSVMDTPDQFDTFDPGWANGGEAEFKIQFDKTQQATVYGLFRTPKAYRIVYNDASTTVGASGSIMTFPGYIKTFANEIDRKQLVTADITIKIVGKPVFVPGT